MLTRTTPRASVLAGLVVIVIAAIAFLLIKDQANRLEDSQRQATARHWAAAGLQNPVTTLKDDGNKRTVGTVDKCAVTVEGFTSYTSVVVTTDQGSVSLRQELKFQSDNGQTSPDQVAFGYISRIRQAQELAAYCSAG